MRSSPEVEVYLLGASRIEYGNKRLEVPRQQARALFFRLAYRLEPVARDHLCFLFWPDVPDQEARRKLTLLLSHLRRALPSPELLTTSTEDVQLHRQRVWSDSAHFAQQCDTATNPVDLKSLQSALALYQGPLLAGFSAPRNCPEYDLWLANERRSFESMALDAMAALVEAFVARGRAADAIPYAQQYLEADPLAEEMHRQLMQLYAQTGERDAARRQFQRCVEVLERELGVTPLPATYAVYASILEGEIAPPPQATHVAPAWTTLVSPQVAMAGRRQLLQSLQHCFTEATAARGRIVLLVGEAGIGKSRLMQEFVEQLPEQIIILTAASHPGVQTIPYQPIVEALRTMLHQRTLLAGLSASWLSIASLLFPEIRTLYPDTPEPLLLDPEQARGQLFEALSQLLFAASQQATVLLCLDDLHWADSATLDWLTYLARYIGRSRLLVLGTYRSEEAGSVSALRNQLSRLGVLAEMHLTPLDRDDVHQLVSHFYPTEATHPALTARLHHITGGNPFFLLESIQALLENNVAPQEIVRGADLPVSDTVRTTIESRLQRLQPIARQMLEAGAVLGSIFDFEHVRQIAGRRAMEALEGIEELVARRFFKEQQQHYQFHHELIQAVVYHSLSFWRRQLLHRRAAEILEQLHPEPYDSMSGQIAEHYARAELSEKAISFYQRAAEVAERVYATQEAAQYLTKALNLLRDLPNGAAYWAQELDLLIMIGSALSALKGYADPQVGKTYEEALALCNQGGSLAQRFQVLWGLHSHAEVRSDYVQSQSLAKELLALARNTNSAVVIARAHLHVGTGLIELAQYRAALNHLQQAIALHEPDRSHPFVAHLRPDCGLFARCFAAHTLWHLGYPEQALANAHQALAIASERALPYEQAVAHIYSATLHQFRREPNRTYELAQACVAFCTEYNYAYYLTWATILLGWVQVETGAVAAGITQIRQGLADFDQTGAATRKPYYLQLLAVALGAANEIDKGLITVDQALAVAAASSERWAEVELYRVQGELLWRQGKADAAEQVWVQAFTLAQQQQARSLELRVVLSLCRLWRQQGRTTEAHARLTEIYAWFTEGHDTPDLQQAQSLLQELSS